MMPGEKTACRKGLFISIEGLDGCGKTTQIQRILSYLQSKGISVVCTREPGGSPISEKIRKILLDPDNREMTAMTEALLYAASRSQHVSEVILPALKRGDAVLCDRYLDSSIAFQGGGRCLGVQTVSRINDYAIQGLLPDITILLQLNHETALKRRFNASNPDRIEQEKDSFHARVEQAYQLLAYEHPERIVVVDASKSPDDVFADIQSALSRLLPEAE